MFTTKKFKESPQRSRLRTLNDEILTKAEMALLAINDYEMRRSKVMIPSSSFVLSAQSPTKEDITENFDHKVCMLGSSVEYYKLDCREKIFPIKIEFRQVKNCFRFLASFSHMFPSEESHEYDFQIERAMRKTIAPLAKHKDVEGLYICLVARNGVGMMSMQFSFYEKMLGDIKVEAEKSAIRIRKLKDSPSMSRTHSFLTKNNFKFREFTPESDARDYKLRTAASQDRIAQKARLTQRTNFLAKNRLEQTHYNELAFSRKLVRSERNIDRLRETRSRRQDFWVQKEKERTLKEKASENKKVIAMKQKRLQNEQYEKQQITRDAVAFIYLQRFLKLVHARRESICERFRTSAQISMYRNKFCRVLKTSYHKVQQLLPNKKNRDMANVHQALYLLTRMDKQTTQNRAGHVLNQLVNSIRPSLRINDALDHATSFRRKLRLVQKHWRTKFNSRLAMIKLCGERQVYTLLDQFPKFANVLSQFKSGNHLYKLCLEYTKQTTIKFNEMHLSYLVRVDELYDHNRLNEEIRKLNKNLPVKQQKPLLDVSNVPRPPYYRYFRDLDILRGTIRGWFEIELRKFDKKNKKPWDN